MILFLITPPLLETRSAFCVTFTNFFIFLLFTLTATQCIWAYRQVSIVIHRVAVTSFLSVSMPAGFRRHLVGKTLKNAGDCNSALLVS